MVDKLKPGSAAFIKRQMVWRHNSFHGQLRMFEMNLQTMLNTESVRPEAKSTIRELLALTPILRQRLSKRTDS